MNVGFVIPGGGGGGVRSVLRVATGLMDRSHEVSIYYREELGSFKDGLRRMYHAIRYGKGRGWLGSFTGKAMPYRRLTPHVVNNHDAIIGVGVSCVLEIEGLPQRCGVKVHNSRGVEPWCPHEMHSAWSISMPRIVVGSHLVKLMRDAGSSDPIFVAPNGIDAKDYFPSVPDEQRDGVGVVYHGASVKDPELILTVLRRLTELRPQLPLYAFSTFPRPQNLAAKTTFVRFPTLPAARDLYSRSKVWFMASRNEGFGNPLLEAASCGCALVSTDCGGARDIIDDGHSGLIIPVGDADSMVEAIERLLDDEVLRDQLRAKALETARRFSWTHAVDAFERALQSILSGASKASHQDEFVPEKSLVS